MPCAKMAVSRNPLGKDTGIPEDIDHGSHEWLAKELKKML
jgi:hypothetical protein